MKTIHGYAVYSPMLKNIVLQTSSPSRARSIQLAGCLNKKQWSEMYKLGFKTVKTTTNFSN